MFQVTTSLPAPKEPVVPNLKLISYEGQAEEEERIAAAKEAEKQNKGKKGGAAKGDGAPAEISASYAKKLAKKNK